MNALAEREVEPRAAPADLDQAGIGGSRHNRVMFIGTLALALIAFLVSWLVFKAPVVGIILAVVILVFVNGGIYIGNR